jgi:hypothetical protein
MGGGSTGGGGGGHRWVRRSQVSLIGSSLGEVGLLIINIMLSPSSF